MLSVVFLVPHFFVSHQFTHKHCSEHSYDYNNIVRCEWEPVKEMEVHKDGQPHCKGDCNNPKLPAFHEELAENTAE